MCKITVFKEVFDYYYDGDITKEQLADLLLMHYQTKWGDGVNVNDIEDKDLKMIWKTLRHTVKKSAQNAKDYQDRQKAKKTIKDVVPNEFEIPNSQISNTSPSNQLEVSIPQQAEQKPTEAIKTSIEEEFITDEDRYGKIVMDFVDKYYPTLKKVVEIKANYILFPTDENALDTKSADTKLKGLIDGYDFTEEEKSNLVQYLNDWRNEIVKNQYKTTAA
jgi:hypothetical protein